MPARSRHKATSGPHITGSKRKRLPSVASSGSGALHAPDATGLHGETGTHVMPDARIRAAPRMKRRPRAQHVAAPEHPHVDEPVRRPRRKNTKRHKSVEQVMTKTIVDDAFECGVVAHTGRDTTAHVKCDTANGRDTAAAECLHVAAAECLHVAAAECLHVAAAECLHVAAAECDVAVPAVGGIAAHLECNTDPKTVAETSPTVVPRETEGAPANTLEGYDIVTDCECKPSTKAPVSSLTAKEPVSSLTAKAVVDALSISISVTAAAPVHGCGDASAQSSESVESGAWAPHKQPVSTWQVAHAVLGEGTYGVVHACVATVAGERRLCAQKRHKPNTGDAVPADVVREVVPLCSIPPHPCVLRAYGVVLYRREWYTLTPLYSCNLRQFLQRGSVSEPVLRAVAVQLLHGLRHLHAHGFMHRDIKLENILVSASGELVLADLGMCRVSGLPQPAQVDVHVPTASARDAHDADAGAGAGAGASTSAAADATVALDLKYHNARHFVDRVLPQTSEVCTLWTRAPEVSLMLTGGGSASERYTAAMDVWSVGATLLAVVKGAYALVGSYDGDLLCAVWRVLGRPRTDTWPLLAEAARSGNAFAALSDATFPHYGRPAIVHAKLRQLVARPALSEEACAFLVRLLDVMPATRATIDEALAHPFLEGMSLADAVALVGAECARVGVAPPTLPDASRLRAPVLLPAASSLWVDGWKQSRTYASPTYMSRQTDINLKMREILVHWLWEVVLAFKLHHATFFDAVSMIDRYLDRRNLARCKLQLLGVTALLLSTKMHEVSHPDTEEFAFITDHSSTCQQIEVMEADMLATLGGCLLLPPAMRAYNHALALTGFHVVPKSAVSVLVAIFTFADTLPWATSRPCAAACAAIYMSSLLEPSAFEHAPALCAVARDVHAHTQTTDTPCCVPTTERVASSTERIPPTTKKATPPSERTCILRSAAQCATIIRHLPVHSKFRTMWRHGHRGTLVQYDMHPTFNVVFPKP